MIVVLLLAISSAWARIPPSFFIYEQISESVQRPNGTSLILSVSRPMGSGNEELLGTLNINSWESKPGSWPALSILFPSSKEQLKEAVKKFGVAITEESELVRLSREKLYASKDPVNPFYKPDARMHLKRNRGTYAWVHQEGDRSIWIEKDSFLPLKIVAPCPESVSDLGWAKGGNAPCELEWKNIISARRGAPSNSRITLWRDGAPLLFIGIDKVGNAKAFDKMPPSAEFSDAVSAILSTILH